MTARTFFTIETLLPAPTRVVFLTRIGLPRFLHRIHRIAMVKLPHPENEVVLPMIITNSREVMRSVTSPHYCMIARLIFTE